MELYEKIKSLRQDKDIKQKDMAKMLHMEANTYNAYENGHRTMTADLLKNICIILNVSADYLLEIDVDSPYNSLNLKYSKLLDGVADAFLKSQKIEEKEKPKNSQNK